MQRSFSLYYHFSVITIAVCLVSAPTSVFASDGLRTVALSGTPVPGGETGTIFGLFTARTNGSAGPSINNLGQTAFEGRLAGPTISLSNSGVVISEGGGKGLRIVARGESVVVANPFGLPSTFRGPVISDSGDTAFISRFKDPAESTNKVGVWREDGNGNLELITREGASAPGTAPGVNFSTFFDDLDDSSVGLLIDDNGCVAFQAQLTGTEVTDSNDSGIWSEGGGQGLELIAREGSLAPGTESKFFQILPTEGPVMNRLGQIAFNGRVQSNRSGIWAQQSSGELTIASPSGGPPFGSSIINYHPGFNSNGQISFTNSGSLWSNSRGNGFELIARAGQQAVGVPSGVNFSGVFYERVLNARGESAFLGYLYVDGPNVDVTNFNGLWSEGGGKGLQLVVRAGDHAPGTEAGVVFSLFDSQNAPVLNARGQLAFLANLLNAGSNNRGIWAQDSQGHLQLVIREGDEIDVSDDPGVPDLRVVRNLDFAGRSGNDDGKRSGFNDKGQLAFWASFTDGSTGIFVSDLVAVPEPTSITLLGVLMFICSLGRNQIS